MITAVDSSVFFDVIAGSALETTAGRRSLAVALGQGIVVVSAVVYAELVGRFRLRSDLDSFLDVWGCRIEPIETASAHLAGVYFKEYRQRGGSRVRILPDFLIAAHAELSADRILTRDSRFFGESFPKLVAVTPDQLSTRLS